MELLKKQWMDKVDLSRQGFLVRNECNKTLRVEGMRNIL
jgi:hypothetical protein